LTLFVNLKAQTNVFVGANAQMTYNELRYGFITKATYNYFQGAVFIDHNFFKRKIDTGVQLGANFVNLDHIIIGSNIMFDGFIHYPCLNVIQKLDDYNLYIDMTFRPHYRDLIQFEFSLLYNLK
jgi:hypothetical protein